MSTPVNLAGRLAADPELRFTPAGKPVARFTVVTARRVRDNTTGEWSDADVSFWACAAFGPLAENIAESLTKGTAVLVAGRAAQREWEAPDGQRHRRTEVTADDVAPSLRWASAKVTRATRTGGAGRPEADPWADAAPAAAAPGYAAEEPPF